jgi:hypothetical protein
MLLGWIAKKLLATCCSRVRKMGTILAGCSSGNSLHCRSVSDALKLLPNRLLPDFAIPGSFASIYDNMKVFPSTAISTGQGERQKQCGALRCCQSNWAQPLEASTAAAAHLGSGQSSR